MRKLPLLAITAMTALSALPGSAAAASKKPVKMVPLKNGTIIMGTLHKSDRIEEILKNAGIVINGNNCAIITKPGIILPNPEVPEDGLPEIGVPDHEIPDSKPQKPDKPNKPEIDKPDEDGSQISYAEQIVKLVNKERKKAGLSELKLDASITQAAEVRAKEIKKSFSHTRPDGRSFSSALTEQNVSFKGSGENIASGQKSPEEVMKGWMNSAGHRANILNKNYKKIGVGHYQSTSGVNYWTQLFTY